MFLFSSLLGDRSTTKLRTLEIGFATYNVGTLMEASDRTERLQAQEYLRSQATAHGLDVLFLQETRAKKDAVVESASHVRLIAAASNGHGGTEIWIAKRKQNGRSTGATVKDMIVLHCEAELLVVRWRTPQGNFTLVSGHAPHSGRSKVDSHNWWISLTSIISKFHEDHTDELVIGIDANAHFAEDMEPWIGHHGLAETTNLPGQLFSDFLVKYDLFLPSTFEQFHSGHTATWRVGTNKESRCDYVCFPLVWKKAHLQSQPLPDLDAGMSSIDHVALGAWCRFVATAKHRPKASIDRNKIQQAFRLHADELLQSLQCISWSVDAHTHANMMSTSVSHWLTTHCPADKHGPRASYITQDTWSLRTTRLRLQRMIRNVGSMFAQHQSRMALHAWRYGLLLAQIRDEMLHCTFMCLRTHRLVLKALKCSRGLVKKSLRQDRTSYLEELGAEVMDSPPHVMYKILRRGGVYGKKKRDSVQPLPYLKNDKGEVVSSFTEWAEVWRKQFERQESGCERTGEELLNNWISQQSWSMATDAAPVWEQLPTLTELELVFRRTSTGKAYFEDLIPGDLLHHGAAGLAKVLYPLLLKQVLLKQEPILFKGGLLVSAYKKGDPSLTVNYRSLLISPTVGKAFHRLLRADIMEYFDSTALPLQLGGRPGISVTQAAHSLQAFLCFQRICKRSAAIIFLDIRNAFYQLFRQQLVATADDGLTLQVLFSNLGIPLEAIDDYNEMIGGGTSMTSARVPLYLHTQVKELLNSTWFVVPGSAKFTQARRGSRPGDSAADLLFSIAFRHILHSVQHFAEEQGLATTFQWSGTCEPYRDDLSQPEFLQALGPIWADDVAIMLSSEDAGCLLQDVRQVLTKLFDVLIAAGMTPNLAKTKTEVFVDLRGPRSVQVRRQLAQDDYVLYHEARWCHEPVRAVGAYRHLGSWIQTGGKYCKELACRMGIAHTTFTRYRGAIFANSSLSLRKKTQLFNSLIMSALMFNSPAWMLHRTRDLERYSAGIMRLVRRLAQAHFGLVQRNWRDDVVLAFLDFPSPCDLLHQHRLRYLQHLVRQGDRSVWAVLQQGSYWWDMVDLSLTWLCSNVQRPLPSDPVALSWPVWLQHLQCHGAAWKNLLRRATSHAAGQGRKRALWYQFHREIAIMLTHRKFFAFPSRMLDWTQHFCAMCKVTFQSAAAWSVHAFRKHGRTTPSRLVAQGRTCTACGKTYHDHVGLINHIRNSPDCYWRLRQADLCVEAQPALNSRAELDSRTDLRCPVLRSSDSLPAEQAYEAVPPTADQQDLLDQWTVILREWFHFPEVLPEEIREALRTATLHTFLPGHEIQWLASQWRVMLLQEQTTSLNDNFDTGLRGYLDGFTAQWLLQDDEQPIAQIKEPDEVCPMAWFGSFTNSASKTITVCAGGGCPCLFWPT